MGKNDVKKQELDELEFEQDQENFEAEYFEKFAEVFNSMQYGSYFYNPMMSNQFLKNLNMNPVFQDKDRVENMVFNPNDNEMGLRRLSQYLYNTQTPYKRLIHNFVDALDFDWFPIPMNATSDDMNKSQFSSDYKKMWEWFDKFDVKKEFKKVLLGMMLEDGKFTYLRESKNALTLQEMPSDYCMIDASSEYGYLYSFNLLYFQQVGVDINGFSKEFKTYYNQMLDIQQNQAYYPNIKPEMRDGRWAYWQQIKPDNGWVFKFHDTFATLIPPFLGLFIDAIDLEEIKRLESAKSALDTYKMIFGSIPRNKDQNKSGNTKDNFAIDPKTMANYMKFVKNTLPESIDFKAAPLEDVKMFEFTSNADIESIGMAIKRFYNKSGAELSLFGSDKPNASTLKASLQMDMNFVEKVYEQFATFVEYHVNKQLKKYKFKFQFLGTSFDREERRKQALEEWQNGILTPRLPASMGMSLKDLDNSVSLMKHLGFPEKLSPIQTAHTQSSKDGGTTDNGGRPNKDDGDLKDGGEVARDGNTNER